MQIIFHNVNLHGYFFKNCDKVKQLKQNANGCKCVFIIISSQISMFGLRKNSHKNDVNAYGRYENKS